MNSKSNLLCVDDDPSVLSALKRFLHSENYQITTANSAEEALDKLKQNSIQVILCDHRMPGMSGTELLKKVYVEQPNTIRILMTGESDIDLVIDAINEGAIYKYLSKPWNNSEVIETVRQAFVVYSLEEENRQLTKKLQEANNRLNSLNRNLEQRVEEKATQLLRLKFYDETTGLPNKSMMQDSLHELIKKAKREEKDICVLTLGFNNLGKVKQNLPQEKRVELLKAITSIVSNQTRESEKLGRISESTFCLLVSPENSDDTSPATIAQRLIDALATPITIDNNIIHLTNSIGMSVYPGDGTDADSLIRNAESAMTAAGDKCKNGYQYYSNELNKRNKTRLALEAELYDAVKNQEFVLYYQPRVCSETYQIVAAEGLIRWQHPERGLVSPVEFIPLLEETGLIEAVGEWVIQEACSTLREWQDSDITPIRLSVNLSPVQFNSKNLTRHVEEQLMKCSSSKYLELEITETVIMDDVENTQNMLSKLRDLGIKLAIDDFGTGYSSLSYLTKFPVDHLKIDRSFIQGLGIDRDSNALVRSIIALAQSLRMRTIAEGIETREHVHALKVLGCEELQGFLFSRPIQKSELEVLLKKENRKILIDKEDHRTSEEDTRLAVIGAN